MKKCILIVDDVPEIRQIIRLVLGQEEFEIHEAGDGEEGLRLAKEVKPHLVLLDVTMPVLDGYEVCRRLKSSPVTTDIKVMMLTAMTKAEDIQKGARAGADGYFAKPFSPFNLLRQVNDLLSPAR